MKVKVTFTVLMMLALLAASFGQTPGAVRFPSNLDTSVSLLEVSDRASTALSSSVTSGATTINVVSTSLFPATGILTIDDERVYYTSKTSTTFTIVRGQFGSTATTHASGAVVRMNVVARHHEVLRDSNLALQAKVGSSASLPTTTGHVLTVTSSGVTAWQAPSVAAILPVADTQTVIKGSGDATKLIRFEVDGLTTATTRVITVLDANVVMAGSASALTSGRVPYVTTGGLLTDSANFAYSSQIVNLGGSFPGQYLSPSGMAHGITTKASTGVAVWQTVNDNNGGLYLLGIRQVSGSTPAMQLDAVFAVTSPTSTTPAINFSGSKSNGSTSVTTLGAGQLLFRLQDNTTTVFDVDGAGAARHVLNSAASVGLVVKGAASQSADLTQWQNSIGTVQARIDANGKIGINMIPTYTFDATLNSDDRFRLVQTAEQNFGFGLTKNVSAGSNNIAWLFYVPNGGKSLRFYNDSGTGDVFEIRPTREFNIATAVGSTSAQLNVGIDSSSRLGVIVKGAASQSANLQEWQNSGGAILSSFDANGNFGVGFTPSSSQKIVASRSDTAAGTTYVFHTRASAAVTSNQTTNQLNYYAIQTDQVISAGVTDSGYRRGFQFDMFTSNAGFAGTLASQTSMFVNMGIFTAASTATITTVTGLNIDGYNSTSGATIATMYGVKVNTSASTTGTVTTRYDFYGASTTAKNYFAGFLATGADINTAQLNVTPGSSSRVGVLIKGAVSQTANLTEWQNSAGTVLTSIDDDGKFNTFAGFTDAVNIVLGTTTGTKFGTATTQKLGFFNATPIIQPNTTGTATGFTAGAGTNVTDASTFTGGVGSTAYRISDIIKALKDLGLIAE